MDVQAASKSQGCNMASFIWDSVVQHVGMLPRVHLLPASVQAGAPLTGVALHTASQTGLPSQGLKAADLQQEAQREGWKTSVAGTVEVGIIQHTALPLKGSSLAAQVCSPWSSEWWEAVRIGDAHACAQRI